MSSNATLPLVVHFSKQLIRVGFFLFLFIGNISGDTFELFTFSSRDIGFSKLIFVTSRNSYGGFGVSTHLGDVFSSISIPLLIFIL